MATKMIPLKDVSSALMCAIIRQRSTAPDGRKHGRTAAFTQVPFWQRTCRNRKRGATGYEHLQPHHFSPMHTGDMDRVLERVRREHGLAEVRRTWGAGYRALQAEFNSCTVMR